MLGSRTSSRDRSTTTSRSNSQISTNRDRLRYFRYNQYDHYMRECPNVSNDDESDSEEDLNSSSWQMLSQEEETAFQIFDREDLNY